MTNDNIIELNPQSTPDTQQDTFTSIGDDQLDEFLADVKALTMDMPELGSTPTATLTQRRRERANAQEQKLRRNARRFYRGYFIGVAIMLCVLLILMIPLRNWLVRFESTQPDQHSQHIYETLFAKEDWGKIYEQATMETAQFENGENYARYMQAKLEAAQDKQITYYETSAGLSTDHKYIVELDGKKIATFTLTGSVNSETDKTEWEMTDLQLVIDRGHSVTVQRLPGQKVLINGKEVSDDYIVRNISTKAEEYLPEGIHGYGLQELYVDGLMAAPTVEVLDANGEIVPTVFNTDTNIYTSESSVPSEMTDAEKDIILNAAKANALFAIRANSTGDLRKYFDANTQIYKDICNTPTFIQTFASYAFDESVTAVSDFYRYSDDLFSARVVLQLDVTRNSGTVKSLNMNTTYFFTKNAAGTFMVTNISNVNVQEQTQQVRLRFDCNDTILASIFVDASAKSITLPQPDVLPGQEFVGWATRSVADGGQITMNIIFTPGEGGQVPADFTLEPMTLYAVFSAEGAEQ